MACFRSRWSRGPTNPAFAPLRAPVAAELLRLAIGGGMMLAGIGVTLGIAGAFALTRLLTGLLFGLTATGALTMSAPVVILGGVALLRDLFRHAGRPRSTRW